MMVYTLRRLLQIIPSLLVVTFVVFMLVRLVPGDPALLIAGENASPETLRVIREQLGLDRPLNEQYLIYMRGLARGDLGVSIRSKQPVMDEIVSRLPATMELALATAVVFIIAGVLFGVLGALYHNRAIDQIIRIISLLGISIPEFWIGVMLILVVGGYLGILPIAGRGSLSHLVLPALTASFAGTAIVARLVRASLLEVLREDYLRTARAKGLSNSSVIVRHALRNAFIPALTVGGLEFGRMLGGLVVIETVFAWPGFGSLLINGIKSRDYPIVQGSILLFAVMLMVINLVVDLLVGLLDPRIKFD